MTKYRTFTKTDWYAWAGAENFSPKKEPLIYERKMNNGLVELIIIADRNGIELNLFADDEDEGILGYYKEMHLSSIQAEGELSHLIDYLERFTYAPDLTYELDHPSNDLTKGFKSYN